MSYRSSGLTCIDLVSSTRYMYKTDTETLHMVSMNTWSCWHIYDAFVFLHYRNTVHHRLSSEHSLNYLKDTLLWYVFTMYSKWSQMCTFVCLAGAVLTHSPLTTATQARYPALACEMVMWSPSQTGGFAPRSPVTSHSKTIRTQTSVPTSMINISCITL